MTVTFTAYALRQILRQNNQGYRVAGYTTKPGSGLNGLFTYAKDIKRGEYAGF